MARSEHSDNIDAYKGLAQRSPVLALAMLVFLLSLGGIPFVAGFWAKLYVFSAAVDRGLYALAFLGAVLTVVALYVVNLWLRLKAPESPGGLIWLSVFAIGLLVISGWLGGKMVYELGVAVDKPPDARSR